jgi:hypothetical protein
MFTGLTAGTAVAYAEAGDDNYDFDDKLDRYCEMSEEDKAAFIEEHDKAEDHQEKMTEYCMLDETEREAYLEKHADEYKKHDYNIREKMDRYCEMSEEDKAALTEKYPMASDHQEKMTEYCMLEDEDRDAFIVEFMDSIKDKMSEYKDSMKNKMSDYKDPMKNKMSDYKDPMKNKMSDYKDPMKERMSDHRDTMKDQISDHKDSMTSEKKYRTILRASNLTDEQKVDIRAMHSELRDFKHSLRDGSINDSEKQELGEQFMEKAKEFTMTWISPRHQVAAGIDAQLVECRENFQLVMKTSNASPMCVKDTTAEKLIERGIAIYAI